MVNDAQPWLKFNAQSEPPDNHEVPMKLFLQFSRYKIINDH